MKKQKGITLIALIITIIILLILAGVLLDLTLGENGILNEALLAKDKANIKDAEEIIKLVILENKMFENTDDQEGYLENNQLVEKILNKLKSEGYNVKEDNDTIKYGKEEIRISDYVEKKNPHSITFNAPKNTEIILNYNGREIGKLNIGEGNSAISNIYREIGDTIVACCKINDEIIYEKTFKLEENIEINMYPCEKNGDGKALYWYGMQFTNFESGQVKYGSIMISQLGSCSKNDNNINLSFNDTYYDKSAGIGLYCNTNLTNYNNVQIVVKNTKYTGVANVFYIVGDVANDYQESSIKSNYIEYSDGSISKIIDGIKNIEIKDINAQKYINILLFNPSGASDSAYGSLSMDIESIVLK